MATALVIRVEAFLMLPHGLPARLHHGRRDRGGQNRIAEKSVPIACRGTSSVSGHSLIMYEASAVTMLSFDHFLRLSIFGQVSEPPETHAPSNDGYRMIARPLCTARGPT